MDNENIYEINLLYLDKYIRDIENDNNIILNENKIPDTEFKKQLCETGLIKEEKLENSNTKILYNNYKQYEKDINTKQKNDNNNNNIKNDKNIIIGEIYVKSDDINKDLRISYY